MSTASEFVSTNSGFLLTVVATTVGLIGMVLTCGLRSRCSKIKIGCIECQRDVITEDRIKDVAVEVTRPI